MTILHALLLGILEGITEFLPISSTGHLIIASHLLNIPETATLKSFQIAVQLGAIMAVFVTFYKKFFHIHNLLKLFVAFLPTGIIGFALYSLIKTYLLGNWIIVCAALFAGGVIMLLAEHWYTEKHESGPVELRLEDISYKQALLLGLFQSIAMIPGVSRSGATIIGGLYMGISRPLLAEFTFLLAVPTMTVATAYDILKNYKSFSIVDTGNILIGFSTAFVTALLVVRFLLAYIKRHDFKVFAYYRMILAIVVAAVFLL
ncbi:MAG: undecaprenyl-diphosphatase UppP [Candidatus Parcubacteria bacterium]|jgi:undecaprenyl-diphosphatase